MNFPPVKGTGAHQKGTGTFLNMHKASVPHAYWHPWPIRFIERRIDINMHDVMTHLCYDMSCTMYPRQVCFKIRPISVLLNAVDVGMPPCCIARRGGFILRRGLHRVWGHSEIRLNTWELGGGVQMVARN
jgi:hypothetical protein